MNFTVEGGPWGDAHKKAMFPQVWLHGWLSSRTEEKEDLKERIHSVVTGVTLTVTTSTSTTTATTCVPTMNQLEKKFQHYSRLQDPFLPIFCEIQALFSTWSSSRIFLYFFPTILPKKRQHRTALTNLIKTILE